jgi:hypothetical protein
MEHYYGKDAIMQRLGIKLRSTLYRWSCTFSLRIIQLPENQVGGRERIAFMLSTT